MENKFEWNEWKYGKRPSVSGWFLVGGEIIERGEVHKAVRVAYYERGNKFLECDDMAIRVWADLPRF